MANITFTPVGSQLDGDKIADLSFNPGDRLEINFTLDTYTSGLDASLSSLDLQIVQDFGEIEFAVVRTDFDTTTYPTFELGEITSEGDVFSGVFTRQGNPGAAPETINVIVEGEIIATENLVNDGDADLSVNVVNAIDANGTDVTELFTPSEQSIDLQPLPNLSIDKRRIETGNCRKSWLVLYQFPG